MRRDTMRQSKVRNTTATHTALWHLLLVVSLLWPLVTAGQAGAFDATCGDLAADVPTAAPGFPAVVEIHAAGRATGTYRDRATSQGTWQVSSGQFTLTGRGVIVGQLIITAAHVVYPTKVELRPEQHAAVISPIVAVDHTAVSIRTATGDVPADIVHLNHRFDLAILRPRETAPLPPLPFHTTETWWRETPGDVSSLLRPGDCIIALVPERDAHQDALPETAVRAGNIVAPHAASAVATVVTGLNPNTVTISTLMFPGDSGSPVLAFDAGIPQLVGIVTATRHPFEPVSYVSRLDPLLPILEALQNSLPSATRIAHAR
jgi:Trypsin-like peptidase domain